MTKVLLTGAGGFAGHHCLEHLLAETDWDIVVTDSFRHKGKTDRVNEVVYPDKHGHHQGRIWPERTSVVTHDLTAPFSRQAVLAMTRSGPVDYVIAYASQSHVDRSILDPVPFVMNNTAVALTTLELCRELAPKALAWVSTDEVYGPLAGGQEPFTEWSPVLPSNPYAASKAAQEALAISYWRTYGVPLVLVNAMNMFGERQDPEKFVPRVIRSVLSGSEVTIHGSSGDIGSRYWLHARNVADGIRFLLAHRPPSMFPTALRPDRYNIASPDRVDNLRLATMIAEAAGRPLYYRLEDFHATRPGHDPHYGLDPGKIRRLGWRAPVDFAESLVRTVQWSIKNPDWLEE